MKYFNHFNLIPYIDVALMDTYTLTHNPKFMNIAFTLDCSIEVLKEKLKVSKTVYIHPNGIEKWKPIVFELNPDIKLFIFFGSDIFIDNDIQEFGKQFPETEFWIQNYTGIEGGRYKILPIGVNQDYTGTITKDKLLGISYVSNTGGFRREFLQYLNYDTKIHKWLLPKGDISTYLENLSKCYFSVCPMGNGFDTFRFWESLMVKAIPIVLAHDFYDNLLFQYPNIPIIVLKSWDELETLDLSVDKYNSLWNDVDIVLESYWINKIYKYIVE
jgi:hypothetical protein